MAYQPPDDAMSPRPSYYTSPMEWDTLSNEDFIGGQPQSNHNHQEEVTSAAIDADDLRGLTHLSNLSTSSEQDELCETGWTTLYTIGQPIVSWPDVEYPAQSHPSVQGTTLNGWNHRHLDANSVQDPDRPFETAMHPIIPSEHQSRLNDIASTEPLGPDSGMPLVSTDPWTPENSLHSLRPPQSSQLQQYGLPPPPNQATTNQTCSSEELDSHTSRTSYEVAPRINDSVVTWVAPPYRAHKRPSDTTGNGNAHSASTHDSSYGPGQTPNTVNPPMLSVWLSGVGPGSLVPGYDIGPGSSTSSIVSAVSSNVPDPVLCEHCNQPYTGEYRRGNLARHKRQKHGLAEQVYLCEEPGCEKDFKRQDARLKHYRRCHPHRAPEPLQPRN
jgi:hypothetical protein